MCGREVHGDVVDGAHHRTVAVRFGGGGETNAVGDDEGSRSSKGCLCPDCALLGSPNQLMTLSRPLHLHSL